MRIGDPFLYGGQPVTVVGFHSRAEALFGRSRQTAWVIVEDEGGVRRYVAAGDLEPAEPLIAFEQEEEP